MIGVLCASEVNDGGAVEFGGLSAFPGRSQVYPSQWEACSRQEVKFYTQAEVQMSVAEGESIEKTGLERFA